MTNASPSSSRKIHLCTYFDANYLIKGLTLITSAVKWASQSQVQLKIFVVCMDEVTFTVLGQLHLTELSLIQMEDIERGDLALTNCKEDRSRVEYLWTTTPTIILRILEQNPNIESLIYVDADMFFLGPILDVHAEFDDGVDVLIHEHRFPENLAHLSKYGIYNVGLLGFRQSVRARAVLTWWRERCIEWCKSTLEGEKFGDQKYLDDWPTRFQGVKVIKSIGIAAAPWNHSQHTFREVDGEVMIDGSRLLIYHFHAFHFLNEVMVVPVGNSSYHNPLSFYTVVVQRYLRALDESIGRVRLVLPEFRQGLEKADFRLTDEFGFLVRSKYLHLLAPHELPKERRTLNNEWTLFPGRTVLEAL